MRLYPCRLTFHDNLFYETRTLGRLYETGRLLHNIALCYALGFAQTTFHHATDIPGYAAELERVNLNGIYVTPANGDDVRYVVNTFKFGEERTNVIMARSNANVPTFGRAKEVGIGSRFSFAVISETEVRFPEWIRMGIWMSKARLEVGAPVTLSLHTEMKEHTVSAYPMNPADLPDSAKLKLFDLVSMRPNSLVENALIEADAWWKGKTADGGDIWLPAGMHHHAAMPARR